MVKLPRLAELKPRERLLAVLSGVILLMVALDRLVLSPWWRHAQAIRAEIQAMEEALQTHARLMSRGPKVFAELERYRRYFRPPIADDLQMAALLGEIEEIAEASRLLLSEVKPLATEATGDLTRCHALDVRFQCTMEECMDFLFRIETSASLLEIARASLVVNAETPDRLQGSLRVATSTVSPKAIASATANDQATQTVR
jgi:hypothetical protein